MKMILDKIILPAFYILSVIIIAIVIFNLYNDKIKARNTLLNYEDNINIESKNEQIDLELNEANKEEKVTYTSGDENIVKVDENGTLTAVGEGSTTITIENEDKTKSQTIVVNVGKEAIEEYIKENKDKDKDNPVVDNNKTPSKNNESTTPENSTKDENKQPQSPSTNSNNNTPPKDSTSSDKNDNSTTTTPTKPSTNTPTNTKVSVTKVSLNKTKDTINLNTSNKKTTLTATVYPSNASNKQVKWTSSNTSVATVDNGVVTAKSPGVATITATTSDGNKKSTATITVNKRVIIVIGASQVTKMYQNVNSYNSTNYQYKTSDETLVFIHKGGSGIDYQTGAGLSAAKTIINKYESSKNQTNFYIFFPLSGNTIKTFSCDEISTSNNSIKTYAKNYNQAISSLKSSGYNIKGYVVSMHPVRVSQADSKYVVTNENANACKKEYRSNWKYFQFNKAMKSIVESNYSSNLKYQSLFIKIMETNNDRKNFSYKITYNTTDGVHWDESTTKTYVKMMLDYSGNL